MKEGFEECLRVHGSKKRTVLNLVVSVFAIGGGFYILVDGAGWFSWVFIGVASLWAIGSFVGLLGGGSYLELDGDGFVICSLFRKNRFLTGVCSKRMSFG